MPRRPANRPEPVPYDQPIFIAYHHDLGMTHFLTREALSQYITDRCEFNYNEPGDFTIIKVQSGIVTDITVKVKGFTFSDE